MEKWNSNFKLLVLFGMVWWYEDMVMMLDLCFKTVCVHGMVWRCGTSVTFVGQKNSLQLCTLWQTVSNTLNMGFTVSLFPLCIKGDNFHHQTAPHAVNVSKEGKNKINGHPINAKWWSSWGDDMRMYHMFLSKHYICRNHILLVQENAIIWRRKTTKNEDGGQQNSKKKTCFKWPRGKAAPMSPATNIVTVDQQHAGTLFWWNSRPVPEANLRKCHRSSSEKKKKRTGPLKRWPFFQPTTGAILKTSANLHLAVLLYGLHMLKLYFKNLVQYLHMEIIWKVRKSITSGPFIQNQNTLPETDIFALKNRWLQYYIVSF